jgi:hypothetical protein
VRRHTADANPRGVECNLDAYAPIVWERALKDILLSHSCTMETLDDCHEVCWVNTKWRFVLIKIKSENTANFMVADEKTRERLLAHKMGCFQIENLPQSFPDLRIFCAR